MSLLLRFAARSDVGLLRSGNEDAAYAGPRLLAVADGMGGHAAGEVASAEAIAALAPLDEDMPGADLITSLRDAVEAAQGRIRDLVSQNHELEGMGTTLTALLWAGRRLGLVHVGDSRCYLLRNGRLSQITHDHTLVQSLVDEGRLSPEEASSHPQRSLITRALDGRGEVELDLSVRESMVGDRYLLCTDGLSGVVSESTMLEALGEDDPAKACEQLVELALRGGGPDNVTCIVADVVDQPAGQPDGAAPLLLGAVGDRRPGTKPGDSAAARAAIATRQPDGEEEEAPPPPPPTRRGLRKGLILTAVAVVVVLAVLIGVGSAINRAQWYVGATKDSPRTVALFQGFNASLIGVSLSSVNQRSRVPLDALDIFERQQVKNGIQVTGRAAGQQKLAELQQDACTNLAGQLPPPPRPSPTPARSTRTRTSPTPKPSPSPSSTPGPVARMMQSIGCPSPAPAS